jgi:hypothetical protein
MSYARCVLLALSYAFVGRVARSYTTPYGFLGKIGSVLRSLTRVLRMPHACQTQKGQCLTRVGPMSCGCPANALQRSYGARRASSRASPWSDEAIPSARVVNCGHTWGRVGPEAKSLRAATTRAGNQASRPARRAHAPAQSRQLSCPGRFCDGDRRDAPAASPPGRDGRRLRLKRWE